MADQGAMIAPTRKRSRVGESRKQEPPLPPGPLHESELLQFTEGVRFDKKAELDTKKAVRFTLGGLKISWHKES
ncbi:hypothetical protein QVD17_38144 [Tagetes erecta]|uniref:Uncharacterized protein n=1 Tax=Tagetes erecta TaxID=13708 RepID=A0AAD8JV96_TARER|nr:hypothetical protein QVD17_38144 [Tagetes erecta]